MNQTNSTMEQTIIIWEANKRVKENQQWRRKGKHQDDQNLFFGDTVQCCIDEDGKIDEVVEVHEEDDQEDSLSNIVQDR